MLLFLLFLQIEQLKKIRIERKNWLKPIVCIQATFKLEILFFLGGGVSIPTPVIAVKHAFVYLYFLSYDVTIV